MTSSPSSHTAERDARSLTNRFHADRKANVLRSNASSAAKFGTSTTQTTTSLSARLVEFQRSQESLTSTMSLSVEEFRDRNLVVSLYVSHNPFHQSLIGLVYLSAPPDPACLPRQLPSVSRGGSCGCRWRHRRLYCGAESVHRCRPAGACFNSSFARLVVGRPQGKPQLENPLSA